MEFGFGFLDWERNNWWMVGFEALRWRLGFDRAFYLKIIIKVIQLLIIELTYLISTSSFCFWSSEFERIDQTDI